MMYVLIATFDDASNRMGDIATRYVTQLIRTPHRDVALNAYSALMAVPVALRAFSELEVQTVPGAVEILERWYKSDELGKAEVPA